MLCTLNLTELPSHFTSFIRPDVLFILANFLMGAGEYFVLFCPKQSVASDISNLLISFSVDTKAVVAVLAADNCRYKIIVRASRIFSL